MAEELLIAILAAGESRRLGQPKQLVNINGEPLIRRQCRIAIESGVGPVAVICGYMADLCIAQITDLPVAIRRNPQWREGMASSIRHATQAAIEVKAEGLLILHCDQFRTTGQDLQSLHREWRRSASNSPLACRSFHADYAGPPVILSAALYGRLIQLHGDEGARSILSSLDADAVIDVNLPNASDDLDVPEQLDAILS